jgi:hypothetical protein
LDLVRGIDAQRLLLIGIGAEATWVVVTAQTEPQHLLRAHKTG